MLIYSQSRISSSISNDGRAFKLRYSLLTRRIKVNSPGTLVTIRALFFLSNSEQEYVRIGKASMSFFGLFLRILEPSILAMFILLSWISGRKTDGSGKLTGVRGDSSATAREWWYLSMLSSRAAKQARILLKSELNCCQWLKRWPDGDSALK